MIGLFPGLIRVDVSLKIVGLERGVTINAMLRCKAKFVILVK